MDVTGLSGAASTHAMSGASRGAPPQQKMSNLFDSIDVAGSGSIDKAQFEQAFQSKNPPAVFQKQGVDAIFAALDPNNTGSVSKADFVSGMTGLMTALRAPAASTPSTAGAASLETSLQSLNQIDKAAPSANAPQGSVIDLSA